MKFKNHIIITIALIFALSCSVQMEVDVLKDNEESKAELKIILKNIEAKTYKGWWVYGEGHHIFKDEKTLDEYNLEFLDENLKELQDLYLAVCEMEYFPIPESEAWRVPMMQNLLAIRATELQLENYDNREVMEMLHNVCTD